MTEHSTEWSRLSIDVIGVGAEGLTALPAATVQLVARAEAIVSSPRLLSDGAIPDSAVTYPWPRPLAEQLTDLFAPLIGQRVVVLASGDPLFHGVATTLATRLPGVRLRVTPHVSSFQLACARLGWAVHETPHISLVTGDVATVGLLLDSGGRFLVLGRDSSSAREICTYLRERGCGNATVTVLADLGSPQEAVTVGTANIPPSQDSSLAVVAVEPPAGWQGWALTPGLPDSSFEHDGQLTKSDMRAITLCALAPRAGETLWDIGGGSGSIAIEWLRANPTGSARCFERDEERRHHIRRNTRTLGAPGLIVNAAAPDSYPDNEHPDCVFIGGGITARGVLDGAWTSLRAGGRVVANAVTAESVAVLWCARERYGGTLRRISLETETTIGSFTAYRPAFPVWQWRAIKTALTTDDSDERTTPTP